ncbi:hypothetical protein MSNKSG1_15302 [Marinobacter santoriniensis NKSG1]|jgi:1,6-anhydro-N-acetylmuramate kinase|uniref:DUF305 domain-containing protein n=1 Tax=Marinobacter santoriniensis NKSG1 TaxID=1288826 RepID=M7D1Q9_9GAMM|nr:hypothetical protein [Marinobacter santoriniensis]EMP54688.1 hypothetical protein MSNKSG1_15302 [Marinobacter santoriniensis NKSG1]
MKKSTARLTTGLFLAASLFTSAVVSAHQGDNSGMGMSGGGSGNMMQMMNMEGMAEMMKVMSSLSEDDREAMQDACLKMMKSHSGASMESDHHGNAAK